MRKIALSAAALLVLIAVAFAVYCYTRPQPRIDEETLAKIKDGMTEREVIDVIGAPAGNYGLGDGEMPFLLWYSNEPKGVAKDWLGHENGLRVWFDSDGKVVASRLSAVWRPYESHLDMVLQMMHLKEPRWKAISGSYK
jgi:outer membrane protein assembly factor BamE (lipoprotein component of BamABCDE complex)